MEIGTLGFVAIPRAFYSPEPHVNPFYGRPRARDFFVLLLFRANWCDSLAPLPGQGVALKRGQLCLGLRKFAAAEGLSVQSLRTLLEVLEKLDWINTQSNTHGTIVTIKRYDEITNCEVAANTPDGKQSTHAQHTPNTIKTRVTKRTNKKAPAAGSVGKLSASHEKEVTWKP